MIAECTECKCENPTVYEYDGNKLVKVTFSKYLCDECEAFVRGARFVQRVVSEAPTGDVNEAVKGCLVEVEP